MSRKNRNNRYNSRNKNQWDEGLDDYFDDDEEQLESEDDESSEDQDEYDEEEYEDEEYDEEEEEYEDDEEEYDDEEYDDEDVDEEEYDEEDEEEEEEEEEYDEEEEDDEEEEEEDEEDEDDDELEDEINAATESTARKNAGNSDLLSKLRGQMRPQLNEESSESDSESDSESSSEVEINVSPLSLFGQPIVQSGKKNSNPPTSNDSKSVTPQHANARIVQTATVGSKNAESKPSAPIQKSGNGRVITAQSQNGASVSSVQPRDLEAEKAEAEKKQKEKERLENEQKEKEEKSSRILDKFKGKKNSAGETAVNNTKAGAAWLWSGVVWIWSKISSSVVWIWAGIAACFIWVFWTAPKHVWQNWSVFSYKWWSGIGSSVWNVMKMPFVKKAAPTTEEAEAPATDEAAANGLLSSSADASADQEPTLSVVSANSSKKKTRKNATDAAVDADKDESGVTASKEPDSRRRLYWSLTSIGAAAVLCLLVLPSMLPGNKKTDENAVASANDQNNDSDSSNQNENASNQNENGVQSNNPAAISDSDNSSVTTQVSKPEMPNLNSPNGDASNMRNLNNPNGDASNMRNMNNQNSGMPNMRTSSPNSGDPRFGAPSGQYPTSQQNPTAFTAPNGRNNSPNRNAPQTFNNNSAFVPPANTDRVGSQVEVGNAPGSFGGVTSSTRPSGNAPGNITSPSLENPNLGVSAPEIVAPEMPVADDSGADLSLSPIETPDLDVSVPDMGMPLETAAISEPSELDVQAPDMVGSQADAGTVDPDSLGDITSSTPPGGNASDLDLNPDATSLDVPDTGLTIPDESTNEALIPQNVDPNVTVPETPEPEIVNAEDPTADLSEPLNPLSDVNAPSDPFNVASPDVPEDSTVDLTPDPVVTQPDVSVPATPDLTSETPVDVPDLSMPELPDPQPLDSNPEVTSPVEPNPIEMNPVEPSPVEMNPIETPSIPEPSVPEPSIPEPDPIETGALPNGRVDEVVSPKEPISELPNSTGEPTLSAIQTPESSVPTEPLLTPESNLPSNTQVADSPVDTLQSSLADSSVEVGMPGPLVSSNSGTPSADRVGSDVNQGYYNNASSTGSSYGSNEINNNYASENVGGNYSSPLLENKGVYIVQPTDSFWSISQRIYGSGEYAPALARYNSTRIGSQTLSVAVQISTPPVETLERQYPELCPVHKRSAASEASVDAPPGTRVYIVDQEETVMDIAQRELGNVIYCSQIYKLNQQLLSGSIDRVPPGARLLLPVLK